jgi:hypothetical protein
MLKRAEWERYVKAEPNPETQEPSAWEVQYYLPFF